MILLYFKYFYVFVRRYIYNKLFLTTICTHLTYKDSFRALLVMFAYKDSQQLLNEFLTN